MVTNTQRITALEARFAAHDTLHSTSTQHPHVPGAWTPPTPPSGVPVIPAGLGKVFRYVPAENGNQLAPLKILTYPDDHIGQPNQDMTVFNRFTHTRKPTVHDGYLDLRATRRPDNLFDADLVGTGQDNSGLFFGYGLYRAWLRFSVDPCHWPAFWPYDTKGWSGLELDWEKLEDANLRATVHLPAGESKQGVAMPTDITTTFHEFGIDRRATSTTFLLDGKTVATLPGGAASPLAVLLDAKIGFPWAQKPGTGTPDAFVHLAGLTVDA